MTEPHALPTDPLVACPDDLLHQLRAQVNAAQHAPSLAAANVHRECLMELWLLMDRQLTAGYRLPAQWRDAGCA